MRFLISIWRVITLALVLVITLSMAIVSLLNVTQGLVFANRRMEAPARQHQAPRASNETSGSVPSLSAADRQTKARISGAFGRLPLRFESNVGQTDPQVRFISRGPGYNLFLTPTEAVMTLQAANRGSRDKNPQSASRPTGRSPQSVVRMKLVGAHPAPRLEGMDTLPSKSNYFIGNDQSKWRRNVTSYARVRYQNVYPGIDMIYYGNQQQLEYDFVVAPGADPNSIKLGFDGIRKMSVDQQGDLVLQTANGDVRQRKPVIYQEVNGRRQEIAGSYLMAGKRKVGFQLANYDRTRPLVIDPVLVYSTYLGGSGFGASGLDGAFSIAVDKDGNAYVVGSTNASFDFPLVNPFQPIFGGTISPFLIPDDAFVAKLNQDGSALIYSTYLGGSSFERAWAVAVDRNGNVYVTGSTISKNFPTKNAIQTDLADDDPTSDSSDAFVAKLTADGSALVFSTYLGGTEGDSTGGVAIDWAGNIYLAGSTSSDNFPTKNPLQPVRAGASDAFVAKMKTDGSALIYSTYLGGSNSDSFSLNNIVVDLLGNAYVAGSTSSTDFPTANPLQAANAGEWDVFVTKLNAQGSTLVYSTYLGGNDFDICESVALDLAGNAYVTGETSSTNFPTLNPLQSALSGSSDAFVTKLNRAGSSLCYSTYLGGTDDDRSFAIAVDLIGRAYITGRTFSADFPTFNAAAPRPDDLNGFGDAFVTALNARGSMLVYSTYLGGRSSDVGLAVAVDAWGNAYVGGGTGSEDFPITPGVFQPIFRGPSIPFVGGDAFITKIENRTQRHSNDIEDEEFLRSQGCECTSPEK